MFYMLDDYKFTVVDRFLRYVQIDTQSDPQSNTFPSTEKQKELSELLAKELVQMGLSTAASDQFGYVYATIPSPPYRYNPGLYPRGCKNKAPAHRDLYLIQ